MTRQISMHLYARILLRKPQDRLGQKRVPHRLCACDTHLSYGRIRQELDVADALFQLIEHRDAALKEGITIERRLDALCASIDKSHAQRVLEIGYHLGNSGL